MIISKIPLRITFNGGGSDLPKFFAKEEGLCITATINRYIYVTVHYSFDTKYRIAYSEVEHVDEINQIKHPLVRNTLKRMNWSGPGLEITSVADVPASGTGLGSSSAFTVALVGAIGRLQGKNLTDFECGKIATEIEILLTGDPIGWQDQYAVSNGGFIKQQFLQHEAVIEKVFPDKDKESLFFSELNRRSLFFHIDKKRKAHEILTHQNTLLEANSEGRELTRGLVSLAKASITAIHDFDFHLLGKLLLEGWKSKLQMNGDVEDHELREILNKVEMSPAYGGKLMGAGGGGFLFLIAEEFDHIKIAEIFRDYKMYDFEIVQNTRQIYDLGSLQ